MAAKAQEKGLKRICMGCGTHFYDFTKRPIICPSCDVEFTGEIKVKTRRSRATVANDPDEGQLKKEAAKKAAAEAADDDEEEEVEGEAQVISLDEVKEVEDTADSDDDSPTVKIDLDDDSLDDIETSLDDDLSDDIEADLEEEAKEPEKEKKD